MTDYQNSNAGELSIRIDSGIYSLQAVKNTAYDYSGLAWINISQQGDIITVSIKPKNHEGPSQNIEREFMNHLLDHQVRLDTSNEFKIIREMIVAQAFEPCDNLDEIVDLIADEKK